MAEWDDKNLLRYGDNLHFLRDSGLFPDECIDLVYLDPPFNSQQSYNVLFKEAEGTPAAAQIKAFEDTWRWDQTANEALTQIHTDPAVPAPLAELMKTFISFLRPSPMMAYLVQMAIRLVHLHRVLKPTGSLYLHCDPTASHYLKLILDAVFGPRNFRNEIVWQRTISKSLMTRRLAQNHDTLLCYQKTEDATWNNDALFVAYDPDDLDEKTASKYRHRDEQGRLYRLDSLINPNRNRPNLTYEFLGVTRVWRWTKDRMQRAYEAGLVVQTAPGRVPQLKRYLDEQRGRPLGDVWTDIAPINSRAQERLGYPTQKPLALLKRIIAASSNPGDVILDPFCGCGTTIDAVETLNREQRGPYGRSVPPVEDQGTAETAVPRMGETPMPRRWIGIDITHLSINLIKHRLTRFDPLPEYEVVGEPASVNGAAALAQQDPFQFQFWALGLIGARPAGGRKKKGADQGIDGVRYFVDAFKGKRPQFKRMLVQVKSGKVGVRDVRDFRGTLEREGAEMGAFLTLKDPTEPMRKEAAAAGMYTSPWDQHAYSRIQLLTVEQLLADPDTPNPRTLRIPGGTTQHTLPEAPRHKGKTRQGGLFRNNKDAG